VVSVHFSLQHGLPGGQQVVPHEVVPAGQTHVRVDWLQIFPAGQASVQSEQRASFPIVVTLQLQHFSGKDKFVLHFPQLASEQRFPHFSLQQSCPEPRQQAAG